jgi:DNA-binding NtrC family response regulator
MERLLIIDDDEGIRRIFERLYRDRYAMWFARDGAEAERLLRDEPFDLIICDLSLPDSNGIEILQLSTAIDETVPFIVITAYGTVESAVEAMKLGAVDYISKPFANEEMSVVIDKALRLRADARELRKLRREARERYSFASIIGRSASMQRLFELVRRIADTQTTVLIQGESGTGKELFARAIHQSSSRRDRAFVAINCGALPESLLESELFGHIKGAFTGADRTKIGLFEEATGGTIFLDEIGLVSPGFQTKLLRVLQEREIRPVGSSRTIDIDVRVIAATNEDLRRKVEHGEFREDLYFRLSVIPLLIPPLRERAEDIHLLIDHFMRKISARIGVEPKELSPAARATLLEYRWPGNVRELENLIERLLLTVETRQIERGDLPDEIRGEGQDGDAGLAPGDAAAVGSLKEHVARKRLEVERQAIVDALREVSGNTTRAAQLLGISRGSLYNKLRELREIGMAIRSGETR